MNYNLKLIKHKQISEKEISEICNIKSIFGNYSLDSQREWLKSNLKNEDLHFFLYKRNELVAYLNLIEITVIIDGNYLEAYGIGNVCSKFKGLGYGNKLMDELIKFLIHDSKPGFLFCKDSLVGFYKKNGWNILECDKSEILNNVKIKSMIINYKDKIKFFKYNGKLF